MNDTPAAAPEPIPAAAPVAAPLKPAAQYGPPKPPGPRGPRPVPQSRSDNPGPRGDRPRFDGSAPPQTAPKDFAASKPNKRQLDADIEAELAAAMGDVDIRGALTEAETLHKSQPGAQAINQPGGRRKGTVVSLRGKDVFIDVQGGRSQGVLPIMQFDGKVPKIGDAVEFSVERFDPANGLLILTMTGAAQTVSNWASVSVGMIVEAKVTGVNKTRTGLMVEVSGIKGFMPISQIDIGRVEQPEQFINQILKAEVIELNREERNLILSRKSLQEREREAQSEQFWAGLEVGQTRTGTIRSLQTFGAFVDLGAADGLIPIGELSWKRINHPDEIVALGQRVEVVVKRLDQTAKRISLSLKQLLANPWDEFALRNRPGARLKGVVTRLADFGAFVELTPGIEGLIHVSELSTDRVRRVRDVVTEGQEVEVQILNLDTEAKRIALSMKSILAGEQAIQEVAEQAEEEEDRAEAAERMANRAANPNLRGGIGGPRFTYPAN